MLPTCQREAGGNLRSSRLGVLLGGVSAVVLVLTLNSHPLPAAAAPFPGNNSQTIADGPSHLYCFSDGFDRGRPPSVVATDRP